MVYRKIFHKPFSKTFHTSTLPLYSLSRPTSLCSPRATLHVLRLPHKNPPPLSSFSHRPPYPLGLVIGLVQEHIYDPLGLGVVMTGVVLRWWRWVVGHWASRRSQADLGFADLSFAWLCHWASRWTRARTCSCARTGVAHDCDDLRWVWLSAFCCDGGLWVFLWWFAVDCGGGFAFAIGFWFFFFFSFYIAPNIGKYFSNYFPKCNQTQEKNYFP